MPVQWDAKISLGNVITLGLVAASAAGFGISFYYKANGTADRVEELALQMKEVSEDVNDLNDTVVVKDQNMRLLVDSSASGIKQEINLMRTDVVKITTQQDGLQRQIDDMKDDLRDLEP